MEILQKFVREGELVPTIEEVYEMIQNWGEDLDKFGTG